MFDEFEKDLSQDEKVCLASEASPNILFWNQAIKCVAQMCLQKALPCQ